MKGKTKELLQLIAVCVLVLVTFLLCGVCFAFNITWDTLTDKKPTESEFACIVGVLESVKN